MPISRDGGPGLSSVSLSPDRTQVAPGGGQISVELCVRQQRADPIGNAIRHFVGAQKARVEGRMDVGSEPSGEALMLGDERFCRRATPGRASSQSIGQQPIGTVQVAEVYRAHQPSAGQIR